MQSNRRQMLSFVAILMMVASAFAFTPSARAEASLDISLEGLYNEYSFASVNGTAEYDVTFTNNGDVDFETVSITASFQDTSWKIEEENTVNGFINIDRGIIIFFEQC